MTALDIAIIAVAALSTLFGLVRGLVREVIGLVGLAAAFVLAALFGPSLGVAIGFLPEMPARLAGYAGVFFLTLVAAALLGRLLTALVEAAQLSIPNRLLGGLFGLTRGVAFILAIFVGLILFAPGSSRWVEGSRLGTLAWDYARPLARCVPMGSRRVGAPPPAPTGPGQSL